MWRTDSDPETVQTERSDMVAASAVFLKATYEFRRSLTFWKLVSIQFYYITSSKNSAPPPFKPVRYSHLCIRERHPTRMITNMKLTLFTVFVLLHCQQHLPSFRQEWIRKIGKTSRHTAQPTVGRGLRTARDAARGLGTEKRREDAPRATFEANSWQFTAGGWTANIPASLERVFPVPFCSLQEVSWQRCFETEAVRKDLPQQHGSHPWRWSW
jgi:hypothetical protein